MLQYLVVFACFVCLIIIRIILFKKSYKNNLKSYAEPELLGKEFLENMIRESGELQTSKMINNFKLLVQRNLSALQEQFNLLQEKKSIDLDLINEKLRNTSLILAIIKIRYFVDQQIYNNKMKDITEVIDQNRPLFKQITQWIKDNEKAKKDLKYVYLTAEKYCDYITTTTKPFAMESQKKK